MTNRYDQYSHSAWNQRTLRHALVASLVIHAMIVAGMAFALRAGERENSDFVYQVRFIPKGVPDGAVNDPNAQAVVAEPPGGTVGEAPKLAAPEPAPPKPKEAEPPKPKEPVKPKPEEPVKPKPKEAAPPKPKEKPVEKKPQERLAKADGTAKPDGKAAGKTDGQSKTNGQSSRVGVPGGAGTSGVIPQQGRPDGENVTGIAMQEEGLPHVLGYWIRLVQRNVELKWRMPEGVLIVPNQNSAMISFTVDRKGDLIGEPEIVKDASDLEVAQSGIKAILDAAPFPKLPDEYTQNEQEVVIIFSLVK